MSDAEPDANLHDAEGVDVGHLAASELPEPFADPPELPSVEATPGANETGFSNYKSGLQMAGVFAVCLYVVATTSLLMTRPAATTVVSKAKPTSRAVSEIGAEVAPKIEDADSRIRSSDYGEAIRIDRKSTRLNSSHIPLSRMPSSA